ncbi:M48 family metalloprotease [soil metagenome]
MTAPPTQRGHYAAWRLLCAVPTALASMCIVIIASRGLGQWMPLAVAGWLLVGPLLLVQPAERAAVRVVYRFRPAIGPETEWLASVRDWTQHRYSADTARFDWHVRDDPEPGAFAVGRRSIAVSTGLLRLLWSGGLTEVQGQAVLLHEIGHHVTAGVRYGLVVEWLTCPWRVIYRFSMRLGDLLPGARAGMALFPVILVIAFITARAEAPPERVLPILVLMSLLGWAIFVHPVIDAALARASEHAADRYAAQLGAGPDLAAALQVIAGCGHVPLWGRLRASHPSPRARLRRVANDTPAGSSHDRLRRTASAVAAR